MVGFLGGWGGFEGLGLFGLMIVSIGLFLFVNCIFFFIVWIFLIVNLLRCKLGFMVNFLSILIVFIFNFCKI